MQPDDFSSYSKEDLIEYVEALEQMLSAAIIQLEAQYTKGLEDGIEESLTYYEGEPLEVH